MRTPLLAVALLGAMWAGCLAPDTAHDEGRFDAATGLFHAQRAAAGTTLAVSWAPGALSTVTNSGDADIAVALPAGALLVEDSASGPLRFALPEADMPLAPGASLLFLAPPGRDTLVLGAGGAVVTLAAGPLPAGARPATLLVGENAWDLSAHQEAEFPHRHPGHPSYIGAVEYFADYFAGLGYEVEVDPYGTHDLTMDGALCITARGTSYCPESLVNVVATKRGVEEPGRVIFVAGGHFDTVPGTTYGAFDNTAGTVAVMELARALAPFEFRHTVKFALWGGEENGLLGSNFWVQSNPLARFQVLSYWNLDVVGMTWPAPLPHPDPLVVAAGPDFPSGTSGQAGGPAALMLDWARDLHEGWLGFPSVVDGERVFHYEGVASGQATGYAAVNAQSDHTAFIAAGIPAYFSFNGEALGRVVPRLHTESDTLTNMTKYSLYGRDFDPADPTWESAEAFAAGRAALSRSFETAMWAPLYHAALVDLGVHTPPGAAGLVGGFLPSQ